VAIAIDMQVTPRVSRLATVIQRALANVHPGWVEGEVQRLRRAGSGHVYFTLADEDAVVDCVVWRSEALQIRDWPDDGTLVQAHYRKVDYYARTGRLSIHVDAIRPTGEGELLARKQATLDKLTAEGLVARAARPLPKFPRRVGVIAARESDAMIDVIKALRERWPSVNIVARPALVEGLRAVDSVIEALGHVQDIDGVDVIIVARGGGGVRDLVAFDDERLCRAVFACAVPVLTSIGHTAQRPNCDHLAAAYADVPARAAELVVPSAAELTSELNRHRIGLENVPRLLRSSAADLTALWAGTRPSRTVDRRVLELDSLDSRLEHAAASFYSSRDRALDQAHHRLAQARATLPGPTTLELPCQQLHTVAGRFFNDRVRELDARSTELIAARAGVPKVEDIDVLAARITPAFTRARRTRQDYGRASQGCAMRLTVRSAGDSVNTHDRSLTRPPTCRLLSDSGSRRLHRRWCIPRS
jgi:exodeoxyribonuclease VII large subunit